MKDIRQECKTNSEGKTTERTESSDKKASFLNALINQWSEARKDLRRLVVADIELPSSSFAFINTSNGDGSQSNYRSVRVAQLLGVSSAHIALLDDSKEGAKHSLDMSSVHRLQCDLINLGEELPNLLTSLKPFPPSSESSEMTSPLPSTHLVDKIATLSKTAAQLLLHLSSFAPLSNMSENLGDSSLHCLATEVLR